MIKVWRKRWFRKQRSIKRSLHGTRIYSILGRHAFHPHLWKSDKRSIAGGLALGLFTAFMPIPFFQMLLAAGGAVLWRVNMPLALVACWVTNPLTAVPIFVAAHKLGKLLLTHHAHVVTVVNLFVPPGKLGGILREGIYLTTGSLLFATLAAAIGYLGVLALWKMAETTGHIKKKPCPPKPEVPPTAI